MAELLEEGPRSLTMTKVGDRVIPTVSYSRCRTCQSPHRVEIERQVAAGYSYLNIERHLETMEEGVVPHPGKHAIQRHAEKHMPMPQQTMRDIINRRAQALGKDIVDEESSLVDYVVVADTVLHKGFEALIQGVITPDMKDVLAASKMMAEFEQMNRGNMDAQIYQEALSAHMQIVMAFVPPDQLEDFGMAVSSNLILRAIYDRMRTIEGSVLPSSEEGG